MYLLNSRNYDVIDRPFSIEWILCRVTSLWHTFAIGQGRGARKNRQMSSFIDGRSSRDRSAQPSRWKRRGDARDSTKGRSDSEFRNSNSGKSNDWERRQKTGHDWGKRGVTRRDHSWGSRDHSEDHGWGSKAPKSSWGHIQSSRSSKTKTESSWGNRTQKSDSGTWHGQSGTTGHGWGRRGSNVRWSEDKRSNSSKNKAEHVWGNGSQRRESSNTLSIPPSNIEERAVPQQGGRTKGFFPNRSWQGTQKRDKSVMRTIESMAKSKDLTKYRGYTLLQKEGWDSKKVDGTPKGPVVPQLTAVQGSGLGNTPLGFAASNIGRDKDSINNQAEDGTNRATMIRLDTNGNCSVLPVTGKLNLKVSEKKHLQYIFEEEFPELFCSQKGAKCQLENVKINFFSGHAGVLLESTDFDLYIAKSEFSRKRWDLKSKQEEKNIRTNNFRSKRRGLGLQNRTETFKQEKSAWMKTRRVNLHAKKYFNVSCYGECLIIFLRSVAWDKNKFNRSNVAYEFGIVDSKLMDAIKENSMAFDKDMFLQVEDMKINSNEMGMGHHNSVKRSHCFYIEAGIKYTKSGYRFDVVPFVKPKVETVS